MLPELKTSPVLLTATHGIHAGTMADHVYMLLLALARGLPGDLRRQMRAEWLPHGVRPLQGLYMGVVGTGAIGLEIIRRAPAFGLLPIAFNRSGRPAAGAHQTFPIGALMEVLPCLDILVLVCPLTPETKGLVGERQLARMKPGSLLINVGRGELVDEAALIQALEEGHLGGAGVDVFAVEPLPAESRLWHLNNVIVTPHVGGWRPDGLAAAVDVFCENLRRYLAHEPLLYQVDKDRGY